MKFYLFVLMLSAIIQSIYCTNYCARDLCPGNQKHIACRNNEKFNSRCPYNARLIDLSNHTITILKYHNNKRNLIAGGKMKGFNPAKQMATMEWDNELAYLAELNVKQCMMKHDNCRSTSKFKYAGQNLALVSYYGQDIDDETLILENLDSWFEEYENANKKQLARYPMNCNRPPIGHFTVMVADRNTRCGCAVARYTSDGYKNFLMACNYAITNMVDEPIYKSGMATYGCKTGKNPNYPNLCSTFEVYKQ